MKASRLLIALFLLATVLVDCVVLTIAHEKAFPHPAVVLTWSLQLSQVNLTGVWLALGRRPGPWRLLGIAAVTVMWSWALEALPGPGAVEQWLVMLTVQGAAVSVPLLIARVLGLQLVDLSTASAAEDATAEPQRLQFSILYLLGWTTALAIVLGTLKYIAPFQTLLLTPVAAWPMALIFVGHAAIALAAVWIVSGKRWPVARIITLILTNVMALAAVVLTFGLIADEFWSLATLYFLDTSLLVGSLWVFRVAGYRLRVRGK